jgi:hypothetical protein
MLRLSLFRSPAFTGAALIALLGYGGFIGTVYAIAVVASHVASPASARSPGPGPP